jgi:hypothetical protein
MANQARREIKPVVRLQEPSAAADKRQSASRVSLVATFLLAATSLAVALTTRLSIPEMTAITASLRETTGAMEARTNGALTDLSGNVKALDSRVNDLSKAVASVPALDSELEATWWFVRDQQLWQVARVRGAPARRRVVSLDARVAVPGAWQSLELPAWDAVASDGGWVRRQGQELVFGCVFEAGVFSSKLEELDVHAVAMSSKTWGTQDRILAILPGGGRTSDARTRIQFFHLHGRRLLKFGAWDVAGPRSLVSMLAVTGFDRGGILTAACVVADRGGNLQWGERSTDGWSARRTEARPVDASSWNRSPLHALLSGGSEGARVEGFGEGPDFLQFVPRDPDSVMLGWASPGHAAFVRCIALDRTVSRQVSAGVLAALIHDDHLVLALNDGQVLAMECRR